MRRPLRPRSPAGALAIGASWLLVLLTACSGSGRDEQAEPDARESAATSASAPAPTAPEPSPEPPSPPPTEAAPAASAGSTPDTTTPVPTTSSPVTSAPRTPVWADEFEGPAGSRPDPTKWRYDVGASGWGNNEWQNYTDRTANAALDGAGHLDLIARREQLPDAHCEFGPCDITSARLVTQGVFAQRYGRFEARIKLPTGVGMWPAFWMLGDPTSPQCAGDADCGEIDIVEALGSKEPERVWGSAHGPGYSGVEGLTREHLLPGGRAFADDYHVYAVDWAPERLTFSVDGVVYQIRTPADVPGKRWVFDHPYYLLLNLAVGGDWPGPPDAGTPFPIRMSVDYVRVYHQGLT